MPSRNFHRQKLASKVATKFQKASFKGAKNLIGDFKVKIDQSNHIKRIDSEIKSISRISLDALDVPSSEDRGRLSQSKPYRTSYLSGTFTVKSGGVFVPQNSKTA